MPNMMPDLPSSAAVWRKVALMTLLLGVALGAGCSARTILRESDYGIVAIPHNSNRWPVRLRDQAHNLMSEHFPAGYEVIREEEYVIGETTHFNHEDRGASIDVISDVLSVGTSSGQGTATTTPQTEYRFHYRSKAAR